MATPGDRMLEDPIQKPEGGGAVAKEGEEEALQSHPWGRPLNPTGPAVRRTQRNCSGMPALKEAGEPRS